MTHGKLTRRTSGLGFTLTELVVVMVLLGVLSVGVAPTLVGLRDDEDLIVAGEIESRMRLVQEIDMNRSDGTCAAVLISDTGIWHQELASCTDGAVIPASGTKGNLAPFDPVLAVDGKQNYRKAVIFDSLGAVAFCGGGSAGADIAIVRAKMDCTVVLGTRGTSITVNSEGRITVR